MAGRRATTTLTKSALALASLNASTRNSLSHQCRAIAVAASARAFGSSAAPFFRPGIVSDRGNVASAKYLASAFTRSFHSTTPNFYSATSSSQVSQNEFTEMAWEGIVGAVEAARNSKQQVVETEHLMKSLLEQKDGLARRILTKAGLDNTTVLQATDEFIDKQPKVTGGTSGPIMGSHLVGLLDNARRQKKDMKDDFVSVEHLVLAFQADTRFGQQLFKNLQLSDKDLKEAVKDVRGNQRVTNQNPEGKYEALDKYGNDLTELARRGKLDPVIGRDDEIRRCIQILSRRTKNNPVIIGEPGVGKTAIAEGLAQRFHTNRPKHTTKERMNPKVTLSLSFLFFLLNFLLIISKSTHAAGGKWVLLQQNIGITAMHMQLLHNDRVVIYDRTDFGMSNLSLPDGKCREDPNDTALKIDCTAHSVEYDVPTNSFRPLMVQTDVWCSSGSISRDGRLIQTGGFNDGERKVRIYEPCTGCDWKEYDNGLAARRWYATNHILPDGRQIIIGGRRQFNYEFYPKSASSSNVYSLPFLVQTNDAKTENNLYPFVFLNVDGNLFIFANNRAILFDYEKNIIVKTYPQIPGGDPRSYPSTGSAVLLPLKNIQAQLVEAEVLLCGGAPKGSHEKAVEGTFVEALKTCGRIKITDPNPQWVVETMPQARVMGDMTLLPDGTVLIINGAALGTAGWKFGRNPVLNPVLYQPNNAVGSRFMQQNPTTIPRMYHSTAILLRDGRVLVGGSNPHIYYEFKNVLFPTELRLEAFNPDYLDAKYANLRPKIVAPKSQGTITYAQKLAVRFSVTGTLATKLVSVTMVAPSFTTHSFSMNHRVLVLAAESVTNVAPSTYQVLVTTPGSGNLAPSGYYIFYVVHQSIPSEGIWVQIL